MHNAVSRKVKGMYGANVYFKRYSTVFTLALSLTKRNIGKWIFYGHRGV